MANPRRPMYAPRINLPFPSMARLLKAGDTMDGLCLACGEWKDGVVEPDAENIKCPSCGAMKVVGFGVVLVKENLFNRSNDASG